MIRSEDGPLMAGPRLAVIGVGGGGNNVVDAMTRANLPGVDFIAVNTDAQALSRSKAPQRFQLGRELTRGLGAGANPDVGRGAALADRERLAELVHGQDMVFVVAGLGGGTGTGATPVVCEVCREAGALTVALVTLPFGFEGKRRARAAREALEVLREQVDTLVVVPNDRLLTLVDANTSMVDAFACVDDVLVRGVRAIASLVRGAGRVNVDFADVRTIMGDQGQALLSVGVGSGPHRAVEAAERAFDSPLLRDAELHGAKHILLNIRGPADLSLHEVHDAATLVGEEAHEDVQLIWGWILDDALHEEVEITIVATGFASEAAHRPAVGWGRRGTRPPGPPEPGEPYDVPSFFRNID